MDAVRELADGFAGCVMGRDLRLEHARASPILVDHPLELVTDAVAWLAPRRTTFDHFTT